MNHPSREEWMSWLYGETSPAERERLDAHLQSCANCQADVQAWRASLKELDTWAVPAPRPAPVSLARYLKWGIAAMLLIGLGFGLARATTPGTDRLRAELKQELRADLEKMTTDKAAAAVQENRRALESFIKTYTAAREEDRTNIVAILEQMETQRVSDYANLRKDLETVAVTAESKLYLTQQQIGQLANNTRPGGNGRP